jgi:6-phosphogluconolactonase
MTIITGCRRALWCALLAVAALLPSVTLAAQHSTDLVYVGTYTDKSSKGIYVFRYNERDGSATPLGLAAETKNPSFFAISPDHKFLYAVNEVGDYGASKNSGGVSAFAIEPHTGKLSFLNEVASGGADPAYIAFDRTGKFLMVANYTGGSVAVFPVLPNGRVGEHSALVQHTGKGSNPERQEAPHAHSINPSPDNRYLIAADLGLDELISYKFDSKAGKISSAQSHFVKLPNGSGPRHFTFAPNGEFAYAISEMAATITAFSYDAETGTLHEMQSVSTLPKGFKGRNDDAEVRVHPSGKFLYASNRGHDTIAVFTIGNDGKLTLIADAPLHGKEPRNFAIDRAGKRMFVGNQNSGSVSVFSIDPKSGKLSYTGKSLAVDSPVCIRFVPLP